MADETMPNQPGAGSETATTPVATGELSAVDAALGTGGKTPNGIGAVDRLAAIDDGAVDDEEEDVDGAEDDEDEDAVDEEMVMEDETDETEETPQSSDDAGTVTLRLATDLRRRLRRRADREGVAPEELAEELLSAAIRRPAAESLTELLARVDKLERTVLELTATRSRPETPAAPRHSEERPRGDFGNRTPGGFGDRNYDRGQSDRPSYGDRGGYAGPRRQDDRPRFSERPPSGGFGRPDSRFGDRPRYDTPDRGPARPSFDRRHDRDESRDRPARRWESPRRGE